jgi:hypothetical protein
MPTINVSTVAGADDGFADASTLYNTQTYVEMGNDATVSYDAYFRFVCSIPAGATITSAYLYYVATQFTAGTLLTIYVEHQAAAAQVTTAANLAARVRSTAHTHWTTGYGDSAWHQSPDFSAALQEVVTAHGPLTAVQVIVEDDSSPGSTFAAGNTYENTGYAPQIFVTYTAAGGGEGGTPGSTFMISYEYHNDAVYPNTIYSQIMYCLPSILIENTPAGLWGAPCNPALYEAAGIRVYSYITGGYEGTKYGNSTDNKDVNITRIAAIAAEGCTGVFMDEVSAYPNAAALTYLGDIRSACLSAGVKLIFNTGLPNFNTWLLSNCDYLMTDEGYVSNRMPTASENAALAKILVCTYPVADAYAAAALTQAAWTNGFYWHYSAAAANWYLAPWTNDYFDLLKVVGLGGGGRGKFQTVPGMRLGGF